MRVKLTWNVCQMNSFQHWAIHIIRSGYAPSSITGLGTLTGGSLLLRVHQCEAAGLVLTSKVEQKWTEDEDQTLPSLFGEKEIVWD